MHSNAIESLFYYIILKIVINFNAVAICIVIINDILSVIYKSKAHFTVYP